jgi:hypothetical protein
VEHFGTLEIIGRVLDLDFFSGHWSFIREFGFRNCFGIRHSDFLHSLRPTHHPLILCRATFLLAPHVADLDLSLTGWLACSFGTAGGLVSIGV